MGQKIKDLQSERMNPGFHSVTWDGTNTSGAPVASGMYFYKLSTANFSINKKCCSLNNPFQKYKVVLHIFNGIVHFLELAFL